MLEMISVFLHLRLIFSSNVILENVLSAFQKNAYPALLGWNILYLYIKSIRYNVSFKVSVS